MAYGTRTVIATDGSCFENPGGAMGWAWARNDGYWMSNGFHTGTNQRAELWAIISALVAHPTGSIVIQTDSQYAMNIATTWAYRWARNGWRRNKGSGKSGSVSNLDLVQLLFRLVSERTDPLKFEWVKGHNGHDLNEQADRRASDATRRAMNAHDDRDSLGLYLDSDGVRSNPFQARILMDIIEVNATKPKPKVEAQQEFSLFADLDKEEEEVATPPAPAPAPAPDLLSGRPTTTPLEGSPIKTQPTFAQKEAEAELTEDIVEIASRAYASESRRQGFPIARNRVDAHEIAIRAALRAVGAYHIEQAAEQVESALADNAEPEPQDEPYVSPRRRR